MSKYELGVLGTGSLGTALGMDAKSRSDTVVTAIAEVDRETRQEAGRSLDVPTASQYDDLDELLAEEELDALVITTPHTLHFNQIQQALDHGLHVLCEKPLVTTVDDAAKLVERDQETDQVLMTGYQRHIEPAHQYARDRWADGDRTPTYVNAEIAEDWIESYEGTWRVRPELSGGGFMFDTGSHLIDAVLWTLDERPASVFAEMDFYDDDERIESGASISIRFENGLVADLSMPGDVERLSERLHVWDDEGSVYIDAPVWRDYEVTRVDADDTVHHPDLSSYDHQTKVEAFIEAIDSGTEPPATARDALRATAVKQAAYESHRRGERVPVALE